MDFNYKRLLGTEFFARIPEKGMNGYKLCYFCNKQEVYNPKSFACSIECQYELDIRTNWGFARDEVFKRDKGICQICKLDCDILKDILLNCDSKQRTRIFDKLDVPKKRRKHRLWDIDHIKPVSSGGGGKNAGLDNLRTLCIWCHQEVTLEYNKKRNKELRRLENANRELNKT